MKNYIFKYLAIFFIAFICLGQSFSFVWAKNALPPHSQTAQLENEALSAYNDYDAPQALTLYTTLVKIYTKQLGAKHEKTLAARLSIVKVLRLKNMYTVCEGYLADFIKEATQVLGNNHPITQEAKSVYLYVFSKLENKIHEEYENLIKEHELVLDFMHPILINTLFDYISLIQDRFNEIPSNAEDYDSIFNYIKGNHNLALNGINKKLGKTHPLYYEFQIRSANLEKNKNKSIKILVAAIDDLQKNLYKNSELLYRLNAHVAMQYKKLGAVTHEKKFADLANKITDEKIATEAEYEWEKSLVFAKDFISPYYYDIIFEEDGIIRKSEQELKNTFYTFKQRLGYHNSETKHAREQYLNLLLQHNKYRKAIALQEAHLKELSRFYDVSLKRSPELVGDFDDMVKGTKEHLTELYVLIGDDISAKKNQENSHLTHDGDYTKAIQRITKEYEDAVKLYGQAHIISLSLLNDLMFPYFELEYYDFMFKYLKNRLMPIENAISDKRNLLISLYDYYHKSAVRSGRKIEAEVIFAELKKYRPILPRSDYNKAFDAFESAINLSEKKNFEETYKMSKQAVQLLNRHVGKYHFKTLQSEQHMAFLNALKKRKDLAKKSMEAAHVKFLLSNQNADLGFIYFYEKMMENDNILKEREKAIFLGKIAIIVAHHARSQNKGLERKTQQVFFKRARLVYEYTIEYLLSMGRKQEAFAILNLYKESELDDFSRRRIAQNNIEEAIFSPQELALYKQYQFFVKRFKEIGIEYVPLDNGKVNISAEEKNRHITLHAEVQKLGKKFKVFMLGVQKTLVQTPSYKNVALQNLHTMQNLLAHMQASAFLHTFSTKNDMYIFFTTPKRLLVRKINISQKNLHALVTQFHTQLMDPQTYIKPIAQRLYTILIRSLEKEIRASHIKTISFSLDGSLRYVPMSALYDGKLWLVESYDVAYFSEAARNTLLSEKPPHTSLIALGVTQKHGAFSALPAVKREIIGITRQNENTKMSSGYFLDEDFTADTFYDVLRKKTPLLHIASHFSFESDDHEKSFLLLGDGTKLTMGELFHIQNVASFSHLDLLTLSACNTGSGITKGDGRELESFGSLAQQNGVRTVLASLWPVADGSTASFMQEFYKRLATKTKGSALSYVQRKFLHGLIGPQHMKTLHAQRGIVRVASNQSATPAKNDWSHPFYWAPFILMGNWN